MELSSRFLRKKKVSNDVPFGSEFIKQLIGVVGYSSSLLRYICVIYICSKCLGLTSAHVRCYIIGTTHDQLQRHLYAMQSTVYEYAYEWHIVLLVLQ